MAEDNLKPCPFCGCKNIVVRKYTAIAGVHYYAQCDQTNGGCGAEIQTYISKKHTIEDMDLSVRSYNCLKRAGIDTLEQLANLSYEELIHIRNLDKHSVENIIEKLKDYGYDTQKFVKE